MKKRFNITATIFDKHGRVISIGHNSYVKTHPLQAQLAQKAGTAKKIFLHAEVAAIIKAGKRIRKAHTIYITRYDAGGSPVNACPCPICSSLIHAVGISNVIYTNN